MERAVVQEMHERGMATGREYALFPWNQDRVDTVLTPFAKVALTVKNNERTTYTRAGGDHAHRSKDDPKHMWVQSYSGIKISGVLNAIFLCEIKRPGDEPTFSLYFNEGKESRREPKLIKTFLPDQLSAALAEWEVIAHTASANLVEI